MMFATAVLLTALCAGTAQAQTQTPAPALSVPAEAQQTTSGIIVAAEVEGRLTIYRSDHELVVRLDKPAGRPLQISLAPGGYEVRLGERGSRRVRFQIGETDQFRIELASFEAPDAAPLETAGTAVRLPASRIPSRAIDPRHRIELRGGGWADGWYDDEDHWRASDSTQGAFGFEYLHFVQPDLGIGIGITGLVRAPGDWDRWEDGGQAQITASIPVVFRWYPLRRATRMRSVEPYVTAGVGPVFGVDALYTGDHGADQRRHHDRTNTSTRGALTVGGRAGGGVDIRLGSAVTLGLAGAWNWDAGFKDDFWRGTRPSGGEFTMALGWTFGR